MDNQNILSQLSSSEGIKKEIDKSQNRITLLERMVQVDLFLNLIVGGIILFVAIFIIAWRFNFINYFQNNQGVVVLNPSPQVEPQVVTPQVVKVADSSAVSPIFINQQGVDIEKAFSAPANNLKLTVNGTLKKEVLGFLPYWATPELDNINTKLLTSISYFGLEVDGEGNIIKEDSAGKIIEPWYRFRSDLNFAKFIKNAKADRIKVYVTLKCFDQKNIENLVTSEKAIDNFITNAIYLVNSKSLDGVNIDFEYIGTPPQPVIDGFSTLITRLNKELKNQYPKSVLSIDTFVDAASNSRIHDIPVLAKNSDALVIMGYDFHTPQSSSPGPVAPIEGNGYSIISFIASYLEKVPPEKLILAVPYYGYDWPVIGKDSDAKTVGTKADVQIYPYAVIAANTKNTQVNWDTIAQSPWYSYKDSTTNLNHIVYFENPRSLGVKYDYINQKNLQGVGIWALGFDGKRTDLLQLLADKFAY